jgi:hypothetical protein
MRVPRRWHSQAAWLHVPGVASAWARQLVLQPGRPALPGQPPASYPARRLPLPDGGRGSASSASVAVSGGALAENVIRAGESIGRLARTPGGAMAEQVEVGDAGSGRHAMMVGCAVTTCLPDCDEYLCGAAAVPGERPGQGHRNPGAAPSDRDASAASCNVDLVIGPGADDRVGGKATFGFGVGVAPAHVVRDRFALFGMAAVVGAVKREVAQGGELGLDPVGLEN